MRVVILCGGFGTRIRDVTDDVPKPMIPIGERPILWHIMKGFARFGYDDFILCLGYKGWAIKRWFLDLQLAGSDFSMRLDEPNQVQLHDAGGVEPWRITFAETGLDTLTGSRIKRIEKYIEGDSFMVTYGDGVGNIAIDELVATHQKHQRLATVTAVRSPGRFGEMEIDHNRVVEFNEKPLVAPGWISGGFFVFHRDIFKRINNEQNIILEQEPLQELAHDGQLMAYHHAGFWHPMDSSRDYKYLNDLYQRGRTPWCDYSDDQDQRRRAAA